MNKTPYEKKLESLVHTASGIFQDLKEPFIANNPDNIRKILRRKGVAETIELSMKILEEESKHHK